MAIKDTLTTVTDGFKTKLDDEMLQRFEIYFKLLVEWNEKMNLTAITDQAFCRQPYTLQLCGCKEECKHY